MDNKWKPFASNKTSQPTSKAPEHGKPPHRWPKKSSARSFAASPKMILSVVAGIIAVTWLVIGLNALWSAKTPQLRSHNSARLQATAADIDNLALPDTIKYGNTDTSLAAVTASYKAMSKQLDALRLQKAYVWNCYPQDIFRINTVTKQADRSLDSLQQSLQTSQEALRVTAKVLQYDPQTDLAPFASEQEPDASERLSRTEQGLKDSVKAIQASTVPYRSALAEPAKQLLGKAEGLKPTEVAAWVQQVHAAQAKIVAVIHDHTQPSLQETAKQLVSLSVRY